MKTSITAILVAALTTGAALAPKPAHAICSQIIYAERAFSTGAGATLYGRTTSTTSVIWLGSTANPTLASLIFSAVAQRNRVQVTGNAAVCPAATPGLHSVGTITSLVLSP